MDRNFYQKLQIEMLGLQVIKGLLPQQMEGVEVDKEENTMSKYKILEISYLTKKSEKWICNICI